MENYKRIVNLLTVAFSILILLDIFLGFKASEEKIEYKLHSEQRSGTIKSRRIKTVLGIETNKNIYILKEPSLYNVSKKDDQILIYKSRVLGEIAKIKYNNVEYNNSAYSIYSFYYLFPVICIISSFSAFILGYFQMSYFDFFLVLSSIMTIYLMISIVTNNMI